MKDDDRISSLPLELKAEILSRIPLKSLVRVKCSSKHWDSEIRTQNFIELYVRCQARNFEFYDDSLSALILLGKSTLYSYDFETNQLRKLPHRPPYSGSTFTKIEVKGSCNGLLCFQESARQFSLYNCVTGTYVVLPSFAPTVPLSKCIIRRDAGFGYDSTSNDYKILALDMVIAKFDQSETLYETHMYSLKSNSWKKIKNMPSGCRMIFFKNALHWTTYSYHSKHEHQAMIVLAFNLGIEAYYELQLPNEGRFSISDTDLFALNGCLHMTDCNIFEDMVTIWIMKEYGAANSWTKLVRFKIMDNQAWRFCPLPCAYSKSGRQIIVGFQEHTDNAIVGDVQCREIKKVTLFDVPDDHEEEHGFFVMPLATSVASDDPLLPVVGRRFYSMQRNNVVVLVIFLLVFLFLVTFSDGIILPQFYRLSSFKLVNWGTNVFLC